MRPFCPWGYRLYMKVLLLSLKMLLNMAFVIVIPYCLMIVCARPITVFPSVGHRNQMDSTRNRPHNDYLSRLGRGRSAEQVVLYRSPSGLRAENHHVWFYHRLTTYLWFYVARQVAPLDHPPQRINQATMQMAARVELTNLRTAHELT